MTNREFLNSLSNYDFVTTIGNDMVLHMPKFFNTEDISKCAEWLDKEYDAECDFRNWKGVSDES